MEYKTSVRTFYNRLVENYGLKINTLYGQNPINQLYDRRENNAIFQEFLSDMNLKGTKVLDVACGLGRWIIRYAKRSANVVAVDLSLNMLNYARANTAKWDVNSSFICCDAENLPFKDDAFDIINCIDALTARPEGPKRSIEEIMHVTNKLSIIEPSNLLSPIVILWWFRNLWRRIKRKLGLKTMEPGFWLFPIQIR